MTTPQISVIIPLYNKEHYIQKALDSVLLQRFKDFEIIIIGGRSTDNSDAIINGYTDSRIRFINEEGKGVSAARNQGIRAAKAELIAFLDADDEWKPNFLENIIFMRQQHPNAGIYATAYSIYIGGVHDRDNVWIPELGTRLLTSYFYDTAVYGRTLFPTSAFVATRKALEMVGGYQEDYRIGEDHDLYGRIALYYQVCYSPDVCVIYNAGAENNCDLLDCAGDVPTERYIYSLSEAERNAFLEREDIKLFLDYYCLKIGGTNVYKGFRKIGREQLKKVSSKSMQVKKWMFICMSYLPLSLSSLPPSLVRAIASRMRLAG